MRIISERGINKHIYPVINTKGKNKKSSLYSLFSGDFPYFVVDENSSWDYNCYLFMDFLSTHIRNKFDFKCENSKDIGKRLIDANDNSLQLLCPLLKNPNFINQLANPDIVSIFTPTVKISREDIKTNKILNFLFKRKDILKKTIEMISTCKIKTKYGLKTLNKKSFDFNSFVWSNINNSFEKLFDVNIIEYTGKNGKKYFNSFELIFKSHLGICFLHNLYSGAFSIINNFKEFYSISKYTNILYRLSLMSISSNWKINLNMKTSLYNLGLNDQDVYYSKKRFLHMIEELHDNKMISILKKEILSNDINITVRKI